MGPDLESRGKSYLAPWNRLAFCGPLIVLVNWVVFGTLAFAQEGQHDSALGDSPVSESLPSSNSEKKAEKTEIETQSDQKETPKGRGSLIIASMPISSPALGTGLIRYSGTFSRCRKNDQVSPPSLVGAAGIVTDNGSRGFAAYADQFLQQDTYRITSLYVRGNLNYDLYGIGVIAGQQGRKFPLEQSGQVVRIEALRQVGWDFFLGVRFWSGGSLVTPRAGSGGETVAGAPPPDLGLHTTLRALGLRVKRDTTPNRFYPIRGTMLDFTSDFFAEAFGSKYSFQTYRFTFNKFGSLSEKQILAYSLFICGTGGQPPFYGNCIYGANNQLRGYTAGQYLDRYMFATQLEYRTDFTEEVGDRCIRRRR